MKITRRLNLFILLMVGLLTFSCSETDPIKNLTSSNTGPYIYSMEGLQQIKSQLADSLHQKEYEELMQKATFFLQKDDFQFVADKLHTAPSGNKNDYMSLHRYTVEDHWGEYVTGDYHVNPQIYDYDRPKLAELNDAVHTLSLAFFFTEEEQYAAKAADLLRAWFFEPETRMNPNLNFAQMNFGSEGDPNRGGYQGIIDTNDFITLLEAVSILYDSASWTPEDHLQLKEWFYHFTSWINGKNNLLRGIGPDLHCNSETYCNNVATWADVQRVVYYLFTEQEDRINSSRYIQPISLKLERQFSADGRQIHEQNRNKSQHYYYYNLKAMVHLMTARKNRTGYDRDREYLTSNQLTGFRNALGTLAHLMETGDPKNYFNLESGFDNCRYLEIFRPAAHLLEEKLFEDLSRRLIDQGCIQPNISLVFPPYEPADVAADPPF